MKSVRVHISLGGAVMAAIVALTACGGGEDATATPALTPTATARPGTPIPTVVTPTAGAAATATPALTPTATARPGTPVSPVITPTAGAVATATRAPVPTATPTTGAVPTPIVLPGKRGGTLQLHALDSTITDTLTASGQTAYHITAPALNNLIFPDPYGDGHTLVGDLAERWEVSGEGKVITFFLRKGISWHDAAPFTSRDVAYNIDRAWKPRPATAVALQPNLQPIQKIEAPDGLTVRLTLSVPSHALLQSLSTQLFLIYPSHMAFPEKFADWQQTPIGTGPFKFKSIRADIGFIVVRNDAYWKSGLPYLDEIVNTSMSGEVAAAALRVGRLDVSSVGDSSTVERAGIPEMEKRGLVLKPVTLGPIFLHFNQTDPWTNPKVREAVDLALDRQAFVAALLQGRGTPYAAPSMPPELGGQWGISTELMKTRPGYRPDKTVDLARARQLLGEAGIDPSKYTVNLVANASIILTVATIWEATFRELGFKTKVEDLGPSAALSRRLLQGTFDISPQLSLSSYDDIASVADVFATGGAFNYGKWSDPEVDRLLVQQDSSLDLAQRKRLLLELQERILQDRFTLTTAWRRGFAWHWPWAKNYPPNLPFVSSPRFRHEQIYLER